MKIEHKKAANPLKDLPPFQQKTFTVAIILAFLGIFVWFIKILFF
ncbi:hypothetical protein [Mucilaginibacter gotjawali]|nr:hypothetical protein [Mucilaginibacter gotjawali]MBB3056265.1 hypothetical protein [Mucilaginibacter gotjawali]